MAKPGEYWSKIGHVGVIVIREINTGDRPQDKVRYASRLGLLPSRSRGHEEAVGFAGGVRLSKPQVNSESGLEGFTGDWQPKEGG